jgi:hypothetical protein
MSADAPNARRRWRLALVAILVSSFGANAIVVGVGAMTLRFRDAARSVSSGLVAGAGTAWYESQVVRLDPESVTAASGVDGARHSNLYETVDGSPSPLFEGTIWLGAEWLRAVHYRRSASYVTARNYLWSGERFDARFAWCDHDSLVYDSTRRPAHGDLLVREAFCVGWPCRSTVGYADWHGREMPSYGERPTILAATSDVLRSTGLLWFGSTDGSGTLASATFVLPLQPIWSGLLLNVAAWCVPGAFVLLAWRGFGAARGYRRRRRQGRCSRCGYILHGAPRCPECGAEDSRAPN